MEEHLPSVHKVPGSVELGGGWGSVEEHLPSVHKVPGSGFKIPSATKRQKPSVKDKKEDMPPGNGVSQTEDE